jgi:hypothetical protein
MAYTKNNQNYAVSNAKVTVPAAAAITGTIQTFGIGIKGTGTAFLTEMRVGDWLYNATTNEVRKINQVLNDDTAYINRVFASDLAALSQCITIKRNDAYNVKSISLLVGSASAIVDGTETVPAGTGWESSKSNIAPMSQQDVVDPIVLNATGTTVQVTILR